MNNKNLICGLSLLVGLGGCGGGSGTTPPPVVTNTPPSVTVQDPDQTVGSEQTTVTLKINASDDGTIASIAWTQKSGPAVTLSGADTDTITFDTPMITFANGDQQLTFNVAVTDDKGAVTAKDVSVTIQPNNHAPTISVDAPENVYGGATVNIIATVTDADGSISSYQWQQLEGTTLAFDTTDSAELTTVAPMVTEAETAKLQLTVTDDKGATTESTLDVTLNPPSLSLTGDSSVETKSGAFTTLNWQLQSSDSQVTYSLTRDDTGEALTLISSDASKGTFEAPSALDEDITLPLTVTVQNSVGDSRTQAVELNIKAARQQFAAKQVLMTLPEDGFDIREVFLEDMDMDGDADVLIRHDGGATLWYKNQGDFDIDLTAHWVAGKQDWIDPAFLALTDIDGNGSPDVAKTEAIDGRWGLYYSPNDGTGIYRSTEKLVDFPEGIRRAPEDQTLQPFTAQNGKHYLLYNGSIDSWDDTGFLYLLERTDSGFEQVNEQIINDRTVMNTSVVSCNVGPDGQTDLFYRTAMEQDRTPERQTALYRLSQSDNYQTPQLISEDPAYSAHMVCLNNSDGSATLLQHIESETGAKTTRLTYADGSYQVTEPGFLLSDMAYLDSDERLDTADVNLDGNDDIVFKKEGKVFLSNADDLGFTLSGAFSSSHSIAFVAGFTRQYRLNDTTLWMSDPITNEQGFDESKGHSVTFPEKKSFTGLSLIGEHLLVSTTNSTYRTTRTPMKLDEQGALVDSSAFSFGDFKDAYHWRLFDHNKDGKLDVVYQYDFYDGSSYGSTAIAVRTAQEGGFGEEQVLFTREQSAPSDYLSRVVDVNDDGHLDFALANNEITFYESWYLYNPDSQSYEIPEDHSWFTVDVDPQQHSASGKAFADMDGDGDLDIVRIGDFSVFCSVTYMCGQAQIAEQTAPGVYAPWQNVMTEKMGIDLFRISDVNLDGKQDVIVKTRVIDPTSEEPAQLNWFTQGENGGFESRPMTRVPHQYGNEFRQGQRYFYDLDGYQGLLTLYDFNAELQQPVVNQQVKIDTHDNNRVLLDLDKDGDTDIIYFEEYKLHWIENLGNGE